MDNAKLRSDPNRAIWIKTTCPNCHKEFTYNKQISRRKKFCSKKCAREYIYETKYKRKNDSRKDYSSSLRVCPRCGKTFQGYAAAKYCPECLEWLAYNADTADKRSSYRSQFSVRKDCWDKSLKKVRRITEKYIIFDKEYYTKKEICKAYNTSIRTLNVRLKKGMTAEEAVTDIIKKRRNLIKKLLLNEETIADIMKRGKRNDK